MIRYQKYGVLIGTVARMSIYVFDKSGDDPHFLVTNKSGTFNARIKISHPEYMPDTNNRLRRLQIKGLVGFLGSPHDDDRTKWDYLVQSWNDRNPRNKVRKTLPMPNYMKLGR